MSIQHYQRVIALLPGATMIVTSSGKVLAANRPATMLLNSIDPTNFSILEAIPPEVHSDTLEYLRHCAKSSQPMVGSIRFKAELQLPIYSAYGAVLEPQSAKNEPIILLRMQAREESNIRFSTLQNQVDDLNKEIAQRLSVEHELRNQTNRLQVTLTSIGDAVIITDEQTRITFLNPVAEELTGWQLEQAAGNPVTDVFVTIDEKTGLRLENPAEKAIHQGAVIANHTDAVLISKQGAQLSIETTAAPISLDAQIEGVIIVFHDVSEKRLLERQLLERAERLEIMNQRKNQFLTMLAHELRSPLTPISNAIQMMKLHAEIPEVFDEPRQVIERQTNHLKRLIDDMLDVSRITSGKMNIVKAQVDLASLIDSVCNDFKSQFDELKITCIREMSTSVIRLDADSDRITQVLHNLLNNALKFTPEGGSITVSLSERENSAVLEVRDNGKGFEDGALQDMFEPFTQAEQALDRSAGGLGLGLSLVKGIVELHDGNVSASSNGLDQGAKIVITLPLANGDARPVVESDADERVKSHRILLIEDDHDSADTMKQLLELLGHEVYWASTGPDGVEQAPKIKPTLIICDIGLPGLDGFAVAKLLRKCVITSSIPIVALSGYGEADFITRAKEAGFDRHITKPASLADIEAALEVTH